MTCQIPINLSLQLREVDCNFLLAYSPKRVRAHCFTGMQAGNSQRGKEEEEVISERRASSKGFTYRASGDWNAWEQYKGASVSSVYARLKVRRLKGEQ